MEKPKLLFFTVFGLVVPALIFFTSHISESDKEKADCLCRERGGIFRLYNDLGCIALVCQDKEHFWNIRNIYCDGAP